MSGLNKILVIGNVGTDPEMRYTPSGTAVTEFRLAVNRRFNTREGQQQEETEWFTIIAWDRLADQVNQYLTKGRRAFVEGRFHSRTWQGNDGQTRVVNEIVAQQVLFLDRSGSAAWDEEGGPAAASPEGGPAAASPQAQAAPAASEADAAAPANDVEELPW